MEPPADPARFSPRWIKEQERYLNKHAAPLHRLRLDALSKRDVAEALTDFRSVAGNRAFATISALMAYAVKHELVDSNPLLGAAKPLAVERKRKRVLSELELGLFWNVSYELGVFGRIVRLLVLHARRESDVGNLQWPQLDLEQGIWLLPGHLPDGRIGNKSLVDHKLPLVPELVEELKAVPRRRGKPYLFGATGRSGFSGWSSGVARLRALVEAEHRRVLGGSAHAEFVNYHGSWHLHDLRRTFMSWCNDTIAMSELSDVTRTCLGHKIGGIEEVYNCATYVEKKRRVYRAWTDHVKVCSSNLYRGSSDSDEHTSLKGEQLE